MTPAFRGTSSYVPPKSHAPFDVTPQIPIYLHEQNGHYLLTRDI